MQKTRPDPQKRPMKTFLIPDYKLIDVEKDKIFLVTEDVTYYLFVYKLDI